MGYSARYHAASLAAVFLALAIGIVIGVGLGQDVVASSTEGLEESLQDDVDEARAELEEREVELDREREFGVSIYPAVVEDRLEGERIGLLALGNLPEDTAEEIEFALRPTGARVTKVAVVRVPPDLGELEDALDGQPGERLADDPDAVEAVGERIGTQLATGGPLLRDAQEQILARFSGEAERVAHVIVVRDVPDEHASEEEAELASRFEDGVLDGLVAAAAGAVGVELADTDPSSVPFFDSHDLATVDSVDLTSGKVAMVLALLGAEGNFGIKEDADRLLPELLPPAGGRGGGAGGVLGAPGQDAR